jgi:hypothetical protein
LSLSLHAQNAPECDLDTPPISARLNFGISRPEYFFKPIPKCNTRDKRDDVSVIIGGANYIVDMKSGQKTRIPGPYDGVPVVDCEFIVSPSPGNYINFFDRDEINKNSMPVFSDGANGGQRLDGVYHSLGVLSQTKNPDGSVTKIYRAITDTATTGRQTIMSKDYTMTIGPDGKKVFAENKQAPTPICGNLTGSILRTPILSKNGRALSAYNVDTGTTIIYDVVTQNGENICKVRKDMGFATSKMEFSPDGKKVTFAMNSLQTNPAKVDWYERPLTTDHRMNVAVYDFEEDEITNITSDVQGNNYYPSFTDNNTVTWISQDFANGGVSYSIQRAPLSAGQSRKWVDYSAMRDCKLDDSHALAALSLGLLWNQMCGKMDSTVQAIGSRWINMGRKDCRKLVKNFWDTNKSSLGVSAENFDSGANGKFMKATTANYYNQVIRSFSSKDLLKVCGGIKSAPQTKKPARTATIINAADDNQDDGDGDEFYPDEAVSEERKPYGSCTECHTQGEVVSQMPRGPNDELVATSMPWDKPEKLLDGIEIPSDLRDRFATKKAYLRSLVFSGAMPKNRFLPLEEKEALLKWIDDYVPDR